MCTSSVNAVLGRSTRLLHSIGKWQSLGTHKAADISAHAFIRTHELQQSALQASSFQRRHSLSIWWSYYSTNNGVSRHIGISKPKACDAAWSIGGQSKQRFLDQWLNCWQPMQQLITRTAWGMKMLAISAELECYLEYQLRLSVHVLLQDDTFLAEIF